MGSPDGDEDSVRSCGGVPWGESSKRGTGCLCGASASLSPTSANLVSRSGSDFVPSELSMTFSCKKQRRVV